MDPFQDYADFIDSNGFTFFSGKELTDYAQRKRGSTTNALPPRNLWNHMLPTLRIADRVRRKLGVPLHVTSAYRSPAYNKAVGGAPRSQHLQNRALDLIPKGKTPRALFDELLALREAGEFEGGLGLYRNFVHVDTRGRNATWGV